MLVTSRCGGIGRRAGFKIQHLTYKLVPKIADVAELVDAPDSKSGSFGSGGSIPPVGTDNQQVKLSFTTRLFLFLVGSFLCFSAYFLIFLSGLLYLLFWLGTT